MATVGSLAMGMMAGVTAGMAAGVAAVVVAGMVMGTLSLSDDSCPVAGALSSSSDVL